MIGYWGLRAIANLPSRHSKRRIDSVDLSMGSSPVLELQARATRESWAALFSALTDFALHRSWSAKVRHSVELSIEEWFENLVSHADGPHLWLRIEDLSDAVHMELRDDGPAFDPLAKPAPSLDRSLEDTPIGGLGLHLMRSFAKRITYDRQGPENCLRLEVAKHP